METFETVMRHIQSVLDLPVLKLGETLITIWTIVYLVGLVILLFYFTAKLRQWIVTRVLARSEIELGTREAAGTIIRYIVIVIGFFVILQTAGIDLTTLHVLAGAVGVGIGFGLQNIANNFISGLIILFERPIKIGDRVEVGPVEGDVIRIGARSTTVLTNDDIAIIIPNASFITENVVNWSHTGSKVRFKVPVSVAYNSDVRLVEKLLLEVAHENPDVLEVPPPAVRFLAFGDSGLYFELRAWSASLVHRKGVLISSLNYAICDKFRAHNIEIPYPQRDIHVRSGSIKLEPSQLQQA